MARPRRSPSTPILSPKIGRLADGHGDPHGLKVGLGDTAALDEQTMKGLYTALMAEFPEAPIAAVAREGLFVAMPASFPIGRHPLVQARSGLDLVAPGDRGAVITAWDEMLVRGAGKRVVHLALDPDAAATFHFFDATPTHGIYLQVITPPDATDTEPAAPIRT